ncbi:MAG: zinc-ribbon domain-containing protein, partial [Proteobacteria bacterium]|nr:zinc-ribbon domain-containing protein [Pseudomonadota bacterium]
MQTECPNCQAQFLVTQESLDIADGMVRCGQCDQVFDAEQNLIVVQNSTIEPPTAEEPSPIADSLPAESDLELIEIDFKNDDLDEASKLIDDDLNNNKVDPNDEDIYESLIDNSIQVSSSEESDFDFSLDEELLDSVLKDDFNTDQDINNSDFSLDEHMSEQSSETTSDETNTDAKEEFDTLDSDDDLLAELDQLEASYNDATTLGDSLSNNNSLDSGDSSSIENSLSSEDS